MVDALERGLVAEGYDVDVSTDGPDGLWRAREFPYDLIVLDILLPRMNGYELCRTLREEKNTVPILMLTAKDGDEDQTEGLDLGADDYLTKPFNFSVLLSRINALIRRANPTPALSTISVDQLVLDTMRKECTVAGSPVDLSAREYAVLETLARRVGQPLTRIELLDIVWGSEYETTSNVVDVYVGLLRRKLEEAGQEPTVVETVRGIGYRLADR